MAHNVFIHVPAFGQIVTTTTFLCSHALRDAFNAKGIGSAISSISFPDIAELRSMILTIWYDTVPTSDYLLFVDADMGFPPDLVMDMVLFNEPVVGTLYRHRREPATWVGSGLGTPQTARRGGFMEVEGVGGGVFLIRRDAVRLMLERMPHLADNRVSLHPALDTLRSAGASRLIRAFEKLDIPDRGLISEDLAFCVRWRQCGGQVWANINHRISHVGPYDFGGRYLDAIEHQMAVDLQAAQQALLAPPKPPEPVTVVLPPRPYEAPAEVTVTGRDGAPAMNDPVPAGMAPPPPPKMAEMAESVPFMVRPLVDLVKEISAEEAAE